MKKLIAFILVLALALSFSVTAMAADGNSTVSFKLDNTQISVVVPVAATVTIDADGDFSGVPSASAYFIRNDSIFPVKITSVTAASAGTWTGNWTFADAYTDGDNVIVATLKPGAGTAIPLLGTTPTLNADWNMAASGSTPAGADKIEFTLAGKVHGLTNTISADTAAAAFTITFTVQAGANS